MELRSVVLFVCYEVEFLAPFTERFYALYRQQFNPDPTVPDSVGEEWISVGIFRAKEKSPPSRNRSSMGRLPKERALIIKSKDLGRKGPPLHPRN